MIIRNPQHPKPHLIITAPTLEYILRVPTLHRYFEAKVGPRFGVQGCGSTAQGIGGGFDVVGLGSDRKGRGSPRASITLHHHFHDLGF